MHILLGTAKCCCLPLVTRQGHDDRWGSITGRMFLVDVQERSIVKMVSLR